MEGLIKLGFAMFYFVPVVSECVCVESLGALKRAKKKKSICVVQSGCLLALVGVAPV